MSVALLRLDGVSRDYEIGAGAFRRLAGLTRRLRAVRDVSFEIRRGETIAIVGESGCGKSTLARLIVGLDQPSAGSISMPEGPIRRQMIFQDPFASLNPRWSVGSIIAEPIRFRRLASGREAENRRVAELLEQVGLSSRDAARFPHQFSGGQRQRISIARALADEPDFLVCDEPTSALDVSVQAQILNLMTDLQDRLGLTYLFISHNLAVVHHMADKVGVMYLGRLVEWAQTEMLFKDPLHPYSRMLIDSIPDVGLSGRPRVAVAGEIPNPLNPPPGCAFHPRCPLAIAICRQEAPPLIDRRSHPVACHAV